MTTDVLVKRTNALAGPGRLAFGAALYGLVGVSLGFYYTAFYYGRGGSLIPTSCGLGGPFLYYVAIGDIGDTVVQSWVWVAAFPLSGLLWSASLWIGARLASAPVGFTRLYAATAAASLPLLLPAPWMARALGSTGEGWSFRRLLDVCLREAHGMSPMSMSMAYLGSAVVSLALEYLALRAILPGRRVMVLSVGIPLFLLLIAAAGLLTGYPLGWLSSARHGA